MDNEEIHNSDNKIEEQILIGDDDEDFDERMIDLPFNLFDSD